MASHIDLIDLLGRTSRRKKTLRKNLLHLRPICHLSSIDFLAFSTGAVAVDIYLSNLQSYTSLLAVIMSSEYKTLSAGQAYSQTCRSFSL